MGLHIDKKKELVEAIRAQLKGSISLVLSNIEGVSVAELDRLRKQARGVDVRVRVARNTLVRRALLDTPFEPLKDHCTGSTLIGCSYIDPAAAARLIKELSQTTPKLTLKAGMLEGTLFDESSIHRLADLPSREKALAQLMATIQAPIACLLRTLAAIQEKK